MVFTKMRKNGGKMSTTKRQQQILELLQSERFVTVERLSRLTFTSPSSIRRDLATLQNMCLIRRTHGGAEITGNDGAAAHLNNRMTKNTVGKRIIAKKAASLIHDGQSIMLDGSTTAGFLLPHIAKHKDITLFTNNMITAINAINHGIVTHCLGGRSVNASAVVASTATYRQVAELHTDILFFSSHSLGYDGVVSDPTEEENRLRQIMLEHTKKSVFLCDSDKFGTSSLYRLTTVSDVDVCVFDTPFDKLDTKLTEDEHGHFKSY